MGTRANLIGRGLGVDLVPAIGVLLFASLIGIPAGVISMASFVALLTLAFLIVAYAIGPAALCTRSTARMTEPRTGGRIGSTSPGNLILLIAWAMPFVGWIFAFLALVAGVGAVMASPWRRVRRAEKRANSLPHDAGKPPLVIGSSRHATALTQCCPRWVGRAS